MWETIVNALSVAWTAVSQFFVDAYNVSSKFCLSVYEFLASYLGSPILAIVTLSLIGLLAVLLVIFLIIAIINPAARRKKKLEALLKKQEEYEALRKRFTEISEEINNLNLEIVLTQKRADDAIFNLQEQEKTACAQDDVFCNEHHDKISVAVEKERVLTELLKKQQSGLFYDKEKVESTRQLIEKFASEQNAAATAIINRTNEATQRKENLVAEIQKITDESHAKRDELVTKRDELEAEKKKVKEKLSEMNEEGSHKLTLDDAKTMIDEYDRQRRQLEQEEEDRRNEAIRQAREAYERAYKRRVQVEKDMAEIVEHVKQMQKEQEKLKSLKLSEFVPVTVTTNSREDEKPDDVNIIIADVNCETVFVPESVDKKEETPAQEHVYSVPEVSLVDINSLPEEDVVFIEAFLEELDDETVLDESDLENREPLAFTPVEEPIETTSETDDANLITEPVEKTDTEDLSEEEILDEVAISASELKATKNEDSDADETVEIHQAESEKDGEGDVLTEQIPVETPAPAKKKSVGKIYDDGIPATPIHKKSKFSKPVTRLVKKATEKDGEPETKTKPSATVKTGYNGKWIIAQEDGKFLAKLVASNGGVMFLTPAYSSVNGVRGAIANIKESLATSSVTVTQVKSGKFVYKVLSKNNRAITQSDEYSTKYQCEKALDSAKLFAESAIIVE